AARMAANPAYWPPMMARARGLPPLRRAMNSAARITRSSTLVPAKAATAVTSSAPVTGRIISPVAHSPQVPGAMICGDALADIAGPRGPCGDQADLGVQRVTPPQQPRPARAAAHPCQQQPTLGRGQSLVPMLRPPAWPDTVPFGARA